MADLTPKERLQPSLLDRLTDDQPTSRVESKESRVLSVERLHDCVVRDLMWLLNSENLKSAHDLDDHPEVANSTLNYGIDSLSGRIIDLVNTRDIEDNLLESIRRFEPRLLPDSIRVAVFLDETSMQPNALRFEIESTMWSQPWPLHLLVRAEADLETGAFRVVSSQ